MASSLALVAIRGSPARAFLGSFIMGGLESHDPRPGRSKLGLASIADDRSLGKGMDQDDFVTMPNRKDLGGVHGMESTGEEKWDHLCRHGCGNGLCVFEAGRFLGLAGKNPCRLRYNRALSGIPPRLFAEVVLGRVPVQRMGMVKFR